LGAKGLGVGQFDGGREAPMKTVLTPQERLFALEVERARAAAWVSQEWVGRQVGLSRSKVSEVCCGRYLPTHDTVISLIEALGMDRDRTLRLWQDARGARAERRARDRIARQTPVVGWQRLPVLPVEIVSLLRAQVLAAEELPYRLPGARRPSLSTVYVRQDLGSGLEEARADKWVADPDPLGHGLDPDGLVGHRELGWPSAPGSRGSAPPRVGVRPPSRTVREALDEEEHLLVTGGPGQGKSTLTLRLAAEIAQMWLGHLVPSPGVTSAGGGVAVAVAPLAEPVIPVRLSARELAAHLHRPLPRALAESVSAEYGSLLISGLAPHLLAGRVAGCRWLLLIDALDELADAEQRDRLLRALAGGALGSIDRSYRLVVTSRPLESPGLAALHAAGVARYELQPFDADAVRRFAEHWFDPGEHFPGDAACRLPGDVASRRFLDQVRQAHLDELVRVPLLETIAAIIFEQQGNHWLPDNQYDLYQAYLAYLASARVWPVAESPADSVGASPFDRRVRELLGGLLEHLGITRLEADVSLIHAARAWIAERIPAKQRPVGWQAALTAHLVAAGPLVIRADELRFLHHSFAEHLAATARARQLPVPFDAESGAWQQALHATQHGRAIDYARSVLLHYTHLHLEQADRVVQWLHRNTADFQLVAAELLAQHTPAGLGVIEAFLDTAWAWAMTADYRGQEILQRTTHIAHHPPLAGWLNALMQEPKAPWSSRIKAAIALGTRLRASGSEEAVLLLRATMEDLTLDVGDRLAAAEGLAQVGAEQRQAAARGLRALLTDTATTEYTLRAAAVALAELGSESRAYAVGVLQTTLADATAPVRDVLLAATGLVEIGIEFHDQAASVFRALARNTALRGHERREAALALGALGPAHLEEAAALLEDFVTHRRQSAWEDPAAAAGALAKLGPEYIPLAASHLLAMLADPSTKPHDRWWIASELARLGIAFHADAAAHLRMVLSDPTAHTNARLWAAMGLADLGPEFHPEAAQQFRYLHTDPLASIWDRCAAASQLAELGPAFRDEAAILLRDVLNDPLADADLRCSAASDLIGLGPEFHCDATAGLQILMTDPAGDERNRVLAAAALVRLDLSFHTEAVETMRSILHSPTLDTWSRSLAASLLARLGPSYHAESATALRGILADTDCEESDRVNAARGLAGLGQQYRAEAAAGLRITFERPGDSFFGYDSAVSAFAEFGSEFRTDAADLVRRIVADPATEPRHRQQAATALAALGQEFRREAITGLRAVLADPATDAVSHRDAALALADLGPECHAEAAHVLHARLTEPPIGDYPWQQSVTRLAQLGTGYRRDAIEALRTIMSDSLSATEDRRHAASCLPELGEEVRDEAVAELRALARDRTLSTTQRVPAVWELVRMDPSSREDAARYLAEVLAEDSAPTADRCQAAEHLVKLQRERWPEVTRTLRLMLTSPLAKPKDHLLIIDRLATVGAIRSHERIHMVLAVANDPTATAQDRCDAAMQRALYHRRTAALEIQRDLLTDHLAPISARVPPATTTRSATPLRRETETALREVMSGPEFETKDRFDALAALATLGPEFSSEVTNILRTSIHDPHVSTSVFSHTLLTLGGLNGRLRLEALAIAEGIVSDERRPLQQRHAAARVLLSLTTSPSDALVTLLRQILDEPTTTARDAVQAATSLAQLGHPWRDTAISRLHQLAHDPQLTPYLRQQAATALARYSPSEHSTAAAVVDTLAGERTTPPAARWRLARALADLGPHHRDRAATHLRTMMTDPTIKASARVEAASAAIAIHPQHLQAALTTLREIAYAPATTPAHRNHALVTLGRLARLYSDEAVAGLRAITQNPASGPTNRWRAAHALVQLRRDLRDEAALIVRDLIKHPNTPHHVRWRAARALARWSTTCRDEAHKTLKTLRSTPW
jgi:cellulose synthase operon protein C